MLAVFGCIWLCLKLISTVDTTGINKEQPTMHLLWLHTSAEQLDGGNNQKSTQHDDPRPEPSQPAPRQTKAEDATIETFR